MITHILPQLPKEHQKIIEIIQGELDDDGKPLTIKKTHDKILMKYHQIKE